MKIVEIIHTLDSFRQVVETDASEKVLKRIRKWRDSELVSTDWTQLPDVPVDKEAWASYRQVLRDLPESKEDPRDIEFPVKP